MGKTRKDKSNKLRTKKVFVAMWFNESMNDYRNVIKNVISELGYVPMIIDEKEHNNQIVPEILYEIKTSDLLLLMLQEDVMVFTMKRFMPLV